MKGEDGDEDDADDDEDGKDTIREHSNLPERDEKYWGGLRKTLESFGTDDDVDSHNDHDDRRRGRFAKSSPRHSP